MCVVVRIVVGVIALGMLVLVTPTHAENNSPVGASDAGPKMEDCNCWEDLLEEMLPQKHPANPPIIDDRASSLTS